MHNYKDFIINENEKAIIMWFKKVKYPSIYKEDKTDLILFVEMVDFDVCKYLLEGRNILLGKKANRRYYEKIINEYQYFLKTIDISLFDDYAVQHYKAIISIMDMFIHYTNYQSCSNK